MKGFVVAISRLKFLCPPTMPRDCAVLVAPLAERGNVVVIALAHSTFMTAMVDICLGTANNAPKVCNTTHAPFLRCCR
jgi:hypothetical protein